MTSGAALAGTGPVRDLERELADYLAVKHVLTVSSGTAAILVGLQAGGVGRGDEVITSAYDWGAATSAILQVGAVPVFADIDPLSFTISPDSARDQITERTRGIVATHLFGHPADMVELGRIAALGGFVLVGDAAHALGATVNGRMVTSFGHVTALSFGPGKQIDADGGGALVTDDEMLFEAALRCSQHPLRQEIEGLSRINALAMNHRIHPAAAVAALGQLAGLSESIGFRRQATSHCLESLRHQSGIVVPGVAPWADHAWHTVSPTCSAAVAASCRDVVRGPIIELACDLMPNPTATDLPNSRRRCERGIVVEPDEFLVTVASSDSPISSAYDSPEEEVQ